MYKSRLTITVRLHARSKNKLNKSYRSTLMIRYCRCSGCLAAGPFLEECTWRHSKSGEHGAELQDGRFTMSLRSPVHLMQPYDSSGISATSQLR